MKDWILKQILDWITKNVTKEQIEEWLNYAKSVIVPWIRDKADEFVTFLEAEAKKTETPIDDRLVLFVRWAVEVLLPKPAKLPAA